MKRRDMISMGIILGLIILFWVIIWWQLNRPPDPYVIQSQTITDGVHVQVVIVGYHAISTIAGGMAGLAIERMAA